MSVLRTHRKRACVHAVPDVTIHGRMAATFGRWVAIPWRPLQNRLVVRTVSLMVLEQGKMMKYLSYVAIFAVAVALGFGCVRESGATDDNESGATSSDESNDMEFEVEKTDDEWREQLTAEEYRILREAGTEPAFNNEYNSLKADGTYICAACGQELYSSDDKFESGTGWPSFVRPIEADNVAERSDTQFGMTRTEIVCSRCGGHLGHVFNDGPRPTGLRYCMNSAAMDFVPQDGDANDDDSAE